MTTLRSLAVDVGDESGRIETERVPFQRRRSQFVCVREQNEVCAMNGIKRFKAKVWNSIRRICSCSRDESVYADTKKRDSDGCKLAASDGDGNDDEEARAKRQYRLQANRERKICWKKRILSVITCCYVGSSSDFGLSSGHHWISSWMHWLFRIHLLVAFFFMCMAYFAFALLFAGLIVAAGALNKQCVRVGSFDFGTFGSRFYDAFYLSWTTFSTVGYGSVYPALSNQNNDNASCAFISAVTSFEALIGILYTGFCGAVLFAKVLNIRNVAMVAFSDPIVIRYGSGVENTRLLLENEHLLDDISKSRTHKHHHDHDTDEPHENKGLPCPVLEFRIANLVWDKPNGVYIDAKINVVANVDANDVDPSLRDALDPDTRWKKTISSVMHKIRRKPNTGSTTSFSETTTETTDTSIHSDPASQSTTSDFGQQQSSLESSESSDFYDMYASIHGSASGADEHDDHHQHHWRLLHMPKLFHRQSSLDSDNQSPSDHHEHRVVIDDDPSSKLVTKRIFSKMHLESTDHPYFKRVWLARHILDEHSPVLKPKARRMIRRNHGHWPAELDSFEAVRNSLKFNQIIVSFQGVCNATATTVYCQKIYDFEDVNVGYHFSDMLMLDDEGNVLVNVDKINHVREQNGGGGEPLILHAQNIT